MGYVELVNERGIMYMLSLLLEILLLLVTRFAFVAAMTYVICWVLAIKFVLRYAIAAWLICILIKWVNDSM